MLNIFKYIDYALKAKQGVDAPDELLADTSFGLIEGFFILSFIVLGGLSGISLFIGVSYGYLFFKIFGVILLIILFIDVTIFRFLKKTVNNLSKKVTYSVQEKIKNYQTIDVEAHEIHHE